MSFMEDNYNKIEVIKNFKFINIPVDSRTELKNTEYLKKFKYSKCDKIIDLIKIMGYEIKNGDVKKIEEKKDITYKQIKNDIKNFIIKKEFKQLFNSEAEVRENNILTIAENFIKNYGYKIDKIAVKIKEDDKFINDKKLVVLPLTNIYSCYQRIKLENNKNIDNILFNDDETLYENVFNNNKFINNFIKKCPKNEENCIIEDRDIMEEEEIDEWFEKNEEQEDININIKHNDDF